MNYWPKNADLINKRLLNASMRLLHKEQNSEIYYRGIQFIENSQLSKLIVRVFFH